MRMSLPLKRSAGVSGAALAGLVLYLTAADRPPSLLQAQAPKADPDPFKMQKFLGAGECMQCHTQPKGNFTDDFVLLTEYATWRLQDKHSQAYLVLAGPLGRQIGAILWGDERYVLKSEAGCLNCHAVDVSKDRHGSDFNIKDGVSCDVCHGPAKAWLEPHHTDRENWRRKPPAEKEKLGMRNLRDPAVRARLCLSCHVGEPAEGKVVTHAMYAAGHPPLPNFEVALFSRNMPQHWRDRKDVPFFKRADAAVRKQNYCGTAIHEQAQLVTASSLAAAFAEGRLIAGRARPLKGEFAGDKIRWPELDLPYFREGRFADLWPQFAMAHSECYACHHDLKRASWRQQRGYAGRPPGSPPIRQWPSALAERGLGLADVSAFNKRLARLSTACTRQPFGQPAEVAPAAQDLADWLERHLAGERLEKAEPRYADLLKALCAPYSEAAGKAAASAPVDFESARQIASAVTVLYEAWAPAHANDTKVRALVAGLAKQLNLRPYSQREARFRLLQRQLEELGKVKLLTNKEASDRFLQLSHRGLDEVFAKGSDVRKDAETMLDALQRQPPRAFTEHLLNPAFLKALNQLNERENQTSAAVLIQYDPSAFRRLMRDLAGLLPGG